MPSNIKSENLLTSNTINQLRFSILCPSRKRPESLQRLFESILFTTNSLESIEVLVYLDDDDQLTQPAEFKEFQFVKFFRGRRVWMSLAQNILYAQSHGSIIMACADDFVFRTRDWDKEVERVFEEKRDNFWLVYGNDLGKHAGKIPTHFFIHREWPEKLGYWVNPGRASLWDLWVYEIASELKRVSYLEKVVFEHLNFRQSTSKEVFVDETTIEITKAHTSFRPKDSYKLLERERRIDTILLAEEIGISTPWIRRYFLGEVVSRMPFVKLDKNTKQRVKSLTNIQVVRAGLQKIFKPGVWFKALTVR